jgi:predicted metalloprotease with PDZ domain
MNCYQIIHIATIFLLSIPYYTQELKTVTSQEIRNSVIKAFKSQYNSTNSDIFTKCLDSNNLVYSIEPCIIERHCVLSIHTVFRTDSRGECHLGYIPKDDDQIHRTLIQDISVSSAFGQATIQETDSGVQWRIHAPPNTLVSVHYLAFLDSLTANNQDYYKPFPASFDPNYFILKGISLFLMPHDVGMYLEREYNFELHWIPNPTTPRWQYANRFGSNNRIQKFRASIEVFLNTLYSGGNAGTPEHNNGFDLSSEAIDSSATLSLFTIGVLTDERRHILIKQLKEIIRAERVFWHDTTSFHYLACLAGAGFERVEDLIGFAVHDSFFGILSDKITSINGPVKYLLSHEIMHRWMFPTRIPTKSPTGFGFCAVEGFTEYFARLVLLQSHSISEQEYLHEYNKALNLYYTAEKKNAIADSVNKNFWTDLAIMRIPYYRGDILAHNWNAEITRRSKGTSSFADAFRHILKTQPRITDSVFARELKPFIGRDVMPDIVRYMKKGEVIPPNKNALPFAKLEQANVRSERDSVVMVRVPQYRHITANK